ncbi:MAG TPA: hypothetical protein VGJ97_12400, partial [Anaerolineaceae bacterium]
MLLLTDQDHNRMQPAQTKRWQTYLPISNEQKKALEIYPPVLQQLMVNRGMTTAAEALDFLAGGCP